MRRFYACKTGEGRAMKFAVDKEQPMTIIDIWRVTKVEVSIHADGTAVWVNVDGWGILRVNTGDDSKLYIDIDDRRRHHNKNERVEELSAAVLQELDIAHASEPTLEGLRSVLRKFIENH
jgi:hypothetical protein